MRDVTNQTFDEIAVGATATIARTLTTTDVEALALAAGDVEGFHLEGGSADTGGRSCPGRGGNRDRRGAPQPAPAGARHRDRRDGFSLPRCVPCRRHADRNRDREGARRASAPDRLRVPLHEPERRRAGRGHSHSRRADHAHRLRRRRHSGNDPAAQRCVRARVQALRGTSGAGLRGGASVRSRFAGGARRGRPSAG